MLRCRNAGLGRRPARMRGGCNRLRSFSVSPPLSFIPPGRRFMLYTSIGYWFNGNGADYLSPFYLAGNFLSGTVSRSGQPRLVGSSAGLVAGVAAFLAGLSGFVGAGGFPLHLLLLSRRVLQGILGRSAELRRRRAAQGLSRRTLLPAHHAKCPPLFHVSGGDVHFHPRL